MKKLSVFIQWLGILLAIIVPAAAILSIIAEREKLIWKAFPFPLNTQISQALATAIAALALILLLVLAGVHVSIPKNGRSISWRAFIFSAALVGISVCCLFGLRSLSLPEEVTSSVEQDRQHYYATLHGEFGENSVTHSFYKCNENDLECEVIFQTTSGYDGSRPVLVHDEQRREIHFFRMSHRGWGDLGYTDGPQPREYHNEDSEWMHETSFSLYTYQENSGYQFVMTGCQKAVSSPVTCEFLPFRFGSTAFKKAELGVDQSAQIIQFWLDGQLIFSYDTIPHCHAEGCSTGK